MKENEVTQSSLTLCNRMHCKLAGSNVHGILQARILECIAISFSKECRPTSAYSLMVCVLTLTFQLCIWCIHMGTLSCPRVSAQMVSLWKVPGRKSEAESKDFPTPPFPAQLRNHSRFHQHHSRIPVSRPCPQPSSWDSSEVWVPGDPGEHTCIVQGPLAHTQPWK